MKRDQVLGWLFSGAVAVGALLIFWDGLLPHRPARRAFQPPVAHPEPVMVPIVPPMELPPPVPRHAEKAPALPVLPPLHPVPVKAP